MVYYDCSKFKGSGWPNGRPLLLSKKGKCYFMANIAEQVRALIESTVESCEVSLWDVRFLKEGADYFLRVFIDSENGIGIDDCVKVSHAIDPILDEADPIPQSYCLEVCSPGIERELTREEHFSKMQGKKVTVKLYKAIDGAKEFCGELVAFDGGVKIKLHDGSEKYFNKADYSTVRLADFNEN